MAAAVSIAAFPIAPVPGYPTGMDELITQALELIADESREAGQLLSALGGLRGSESGDYHGAQAVLDRTLAMAGERGTLPWRCER